MKRNLNFLFMMIFLVMSMLVHGQERLVTGQVVDETGETLPGVTIQLEDAATGTTTDMDGTYKINLSDAQDVLIFSFVGYIPQRIKVGNRSTIDVEMESDLVDLSEVVVIGYGT